MEKLNSTLMYVFPGQGAHYVGMGSDLHSEYAAARAVYDQASEAVGLDVAAMSFTGAKEQLDSTDCCQIALLTHSIACLEVFNELTDGIYKPAVVAGHSLGEYSALVAAKALKFDDAIRLVKQRGMIMSEYGRGHMAAFPLDLDSIKELADENHCDIGGCNLPEQTVVCGQKQNLDSLIATVVKKYGPAKTGRFLNTARAFHSHMMIEAAERFRPNLDLVSLQQADAKVMSNYSGDFHSSDPVAVKAALYFQIFNPVKWMQCLDTAINEGINVIIEFGGGAGNSGEGTTQSSVKRGANLKSVTRKTLTRKKPRGIYLPAIDSLTLSQAEKKLRYGLSLQNLDRIDANETQGNQTWMGDKLFRLYVPTTENVPNESVIDLVTKTKALNLNSVVCIYGESQEDNLLFLKECVDSMATDAEPYLEVVVRGSSTSVLHYRGDEIFRQLTDLSGQIQN